MKGYREWIIHYHGNLHQALMGTNTMIDVINEGYAIIKTSDENIAHLREVPQIECIEPSNPIIQVPQNTDPSRLISQIKDKIKGKGQGVLVGWIGQGEKINYNNYTKSNGQSRFICAHDGRRRYTKDQITSMMSRGGQQDNKNQMTAMDRCIGNQGIASASELVLVNWGKNQFYTADALRAIRFIIREAKSRADPLVIYFPFDISKDKKDISLVGQIVDEMSLGHNISLVVGVETEEPSLCARNYGLDSMDTQKHRALTGPYELAAPDAQIDVFLIYNALNVESVIVTPQKTSLYPLIFPYLGVRGTLIEIKELISEYLGKMTTGALAPILGNEPLNIVRTNFKPVSILKNPSPYKGNHTMIGIIDTGIDYTNPAFIGPKGQTRIASIWDQTLGSDSPYGYGTIYTQEMINKALQSPDPFAVVPHRDEWGHGTILTGIAAGYGSYLDGLYEGVAREAQIAVVKLAPASESMQDIYYSQYNPLGFSGLDVARAVQYLTTLANDYQMPISICLPLGTNSGPHDGTNILDSILKIYAENPGVCLVVPAGEEANKSHHASGVLRQEGEEQTTKLKIPKGQGGFTIEVWAMFGDRLEVFLSPPATEDASSQKVLLNNGGTYHLGEGSSVWSQGSRIDIGAGVQMILFSLINPIEGEWLITVRGAVIIDGTYRMWIPKTGMILPETVLFPADAFTTIYSTSASVSLITVACYDEKASGPTSSSGRGFTRDNNVKPDFMVDGLNIAGPLPDNEWGLISGTAAASAITVGISSFIYESQSMQEEEPSNTIGIKAILVNHAIRESTILYPNPSRGYGLLDIN